MTKTYINIGLAFSTDCFEGDKMVWLRWTGWFVFLLLLLCPIASAEDEEKVIVEDFNDVYYMEDTGSVEISTEITFVGDIYDDGDIPIEVVFCTMDWNTLSSEEVNSNKVRTQVGMSHHIKIYEYHNYTDVFSFKTNYTGDIEFRVMVNLGNNRGYNEVHTIHVDSGFDPSDDPIVTEKISLTLIAVVLVVLIIGVVASAYGGKIIYERHRLSSKSMGGLDIQPDETELQISPESSIFKRVPAVRGTRVLRSQISQSEIEDEGS